MDLSQQELPLTAYFARGSKGVGICVASHKRHKPAEDLQSVARSSKRRRSNVHCSATSTSGTPAGQSNSRTNTLQLPTPATSTRKRMRSGRPELAKTPLMSTDASLSPFERNAILLSEEDFAQLESGPTPLKSPQSHQGAEDVVPELPSIPLATPSTGRQRTTKSVGIDSHSGSRTSSHGETSIATPRTLPRKLAEPVQDTDNDSPLTRPRCHLLFKPGWVSPELPDSQVSRAVLPLQELGRPVGLPCFPVDSDCADPFNAHEKTVVSMPRDGVFAQMLKQRTIHSRTSDGQPPDGNAIPMLPIPSSQSQYLLHLDATPKHKRCSQRIERVMSSQTQEERELTLSTPHRSTMVELFAVISPRKYTRGNAQIARPSCSERKSQHVYTLGSTPIVSPNSSPAGPSRSFFATKKGLDELLSKFPSPSRCTSYHSPSYRASTPRRSRRNSIENIPPSHMEDSLTESESDSDILRMMMRDELSAHGLLSQEMNQVPRHSPVARDASPLIGRGSAESNLLRTEDDSATEAESDTEILHCVAEIGKRQPRKVSREETPHLPVISPLVSPTRPRIAPMPSITCSTQFLVQEGAGLSISELGASYPSAMARPPILAESLPSVVRDFICMFPGDESYPADFPESLRD